MIGNSGGSRTLGRSSGGGLGDPNGEQANTSRLSNNNVSRLMGAVLNNARSFNSHGQAHDPNEGFRGYSYNASRTEGIFGDMFGATKELSDEQYRADVIDQASYKGFELFQALQNRTGMYYQETRNAMEFFKRDRNRVVQPVFEMFINEVESNLQLYRFCASYASTFFASDLVTAVFNGTVGEIIGDGKKQLAVLNGNFVNILCLQFLSWLEGHPDAINLMHQMSPPNRKMLDVFENMIDGCQSKLLNLTIGNTQFPFPWRKGVVKRIQERTQVKSTLLEGYDFHGGEQVHGLGDAFKYREGPGAPSNPQADIYNLLCTFTTQSSNNVNIRPGETFDRTFDRPSAGVWGDESSTEIDLNEMVRQINPNNRMNFRFGDFFKEVPGLEHPRYIADPYHFRYISRTLSLKTDENKPEFFRGVWATTNTIPLIRIDWEQGIYDYELISLGGQDLLTVLTNPDKVLPFIAENMKEAAIEAFDDYWEQTNKVVDKENNPTSIPECKTLDEVPNVLYGNQPVEIDSNEEVLSTITSLSNYYDPEEKLSAFVIPFRAKKIFQMETDVLAVDVYKLFPSLVQGKCNTETMRDFYNELLNGFSRIDSDEIKNLISGHVTDVVNRWLIECRFYPEKKDEPGFLAMDDFFDDYDNFTALLKERDLPTLKSFFALVKNDFLRENLTLFSRADAREKFIKREENKFQGELKAVKTKLFESAMVIEREFIVAKINPMVPPSGWDQVVIAKSGIPAFDHVYQKSHETLTKHFDRKVPLLTIYGKDPNGRVWVATESEFDNKVYSLRPISMKSNIQLLRIAK